MWLKLCGRRFFIERRGRWGLVYGYVGKRIIPKETDDADG